MAQIPSTTGLLPVGVGETEGTGDGARLSPKIAENRLGLGEAGGGADILMGILYTDRVAERSLFNQFLSASCRLNKVKMEREGRNVMRSQKSLMHDELRFGMP